MTFQSPIRSIAGTPPTLDRDPAPHRCGRCNNPYGIVRADCPNNPDTAALDDELARLIAEMNS